MAGELDGTLDGVPMALYVQDAHPIREAMEFVRRAEARGFAAVWQADSRLVREATVPMAAFAATTEHIAVGSGVIDIWTRNPARLASLFSTLDDLAPGRILAGLGAWWDPLASKVGISRDRPLRAMREVVDALRLLLRCDGPVTYDGAFVHLDGLQHLAQQPQDGQRRARGPFRQGFDRADAAGGSGRGGRAPAAAGLRRSSGSRPPIC